VVERGGTESGNGRLFVGRGGEEVGLVEEEMGIKGSKPHGRGGLLVICVCVVSNKSSLSSGVGRYDTMLTSNARAFTISSRKHLEVRINSQLPLERC
jgi:hypothetical protein